MNDLKIVRLRVYVVAPDGPGLGLYLDWKRIEHDAALVIDTETM